MSINVFLSNKLPLKKDNILSIIAFDNKVEHDADILITGVPSLNGKKIYEIWEVKENVKQLKYNNINISQTKDYLFGISIIKNSGTYEEIKLEIQKEYTNFFEFSKKNEMKLVKIWHYIPDLLKVYKNKKTNYSLLCEARENVYKEHYKNFNYPAATVIGTNSDKILIYFFSALCNKYKAIENSRQVSSYNYPQNIFLERPMFSRAVSFQLLNEPKKQTMISGTASIRGYESVYKKNVLNQLNEAIENYKTFMALDSTVTNVCRVYIAKSQSANLKFITEILDKVIGSENYVLLKGVICREELLVEIEGIMK